MGKGSGGTLLPQVYAQENGVGGWVNNVVFYSPETGVYEVSTSKGKTTVLGGDARVFYYERNGEEGYQSPEDPKNPKDNEDRIVSGSAIRVSQVAVLKKVSLKEGVNIISFNLLPSPGTANQKLTFEDFLRIANRDGDNVSRIATFRGSQWEGGAQYDFGSKEVKGQRDKALSMGIGYLVVAEKDVTIQVPGYAIKDSIPIAFSSGWNLVGVHGHQKAYTAQSFINSINSTKGLKADNVTWWPTSKGRYEGYQVSEGQTYGQDFAISPLNGYFVRITDLQHERQECKSILWNPGGQNNEECGTQLN
jgi:hypothetical protein